MKYIIILLCSLIAFSSQAQQKITIADIYEKGTFRQKSVRGINWMNDGRYYSTQVENDIIKYDVTSGQQVEILLDGSALQPAIDFVRYSFSSDESQLLLMTEREPIYRRSYRAEFYIYDMGNKSLKKLSDKGKQSYATLSPDGTKVAFTRENNLFYVNLSDMSEVQVTDNGKFNHIINGSTDWVYEEELSFTRAFEWSGDSKTLFYLTFDESNVKEYNMQVWNNGQLYPQDYRFKYPKAGEANSEISATVYDLTSSKKTSVDLGSDQEYYIARIRRTMSPTEFSLVRLNRLQNQLDILHVASTTGKVDIILTEKNQRYIDIDFIDELVYLKNGKHFIHASERSGYKHLYLYGTDGTLVNPITSGNWEVSSVVGVDQTSKRAKVYFTSTEKSPLERQLYAVDINGKNKKLLRGETGWHSTTMGGDFKYYIDSYSNPSQPLKVSLYETKQNKLVKVLEDNAALEATTKSYSITSKEFFTFKNKGGVELNGYMVKPADFSETKKYPVLVFQYSGPGSQQVQMNYGGSPNNYWHQMLAQKGYIVAVIDPRGTGARGEEFKKMTYKQLGKYESEDHIDGAKYLCSLPYIDPSRIGIWGWSYGGYMSSLAMFKGEGLFKAAIAVAPVTNWRFYDTIYTERYMAKPQDNASGYDDNSPVSHSQKLKGNFLLIHGTGDDNVHFQNAVTLQNKLIAEGKQFDSFYYPDRTHSIYRSGARPHLFNMMTEWILENL
ncbi:S9 family peptidase [Fulvivirga sp. M361]|uniref:S9 family peptidase n=1 Tax=Fulvivirga sp. M361 TaxID=2594266 RepID=UPI001179A884|nr:S9 family peptidase [Fulvivirga sp. M361]TRX62537.1 S9 family peptidase [Fulvivirga sp. M361]